MRQRRQVACLRLGGQPLDGEEPTERTDGYWRMCGGPGGPPMIRGAGTDRDSALGLRGQSAEVWRRSLARNGGHEPRSGRTRQAKSTWEPGRLLNPRGRNECTKRWPNNHSRTWAHTRCGRARSHPRVHWWRTSNHALCWQHPLPLP